MVTDERYIDEEFDEVDDVDFEGGDDEECGVGVMPRKFLSDQQPDENGLYEHYAITVDKGQSMMRLDKYLRRISRTARATVSRMRLTMVVSL